MLQWIVDLMKGQETEKYARYNKVSFFMINNGRFR